MRASQAGLSSRGLIALATALLGGATITAAPLEAQGPGVFELMASRKQESTAPLFGGISVARYQGPIGIRFSGALNLTTAQDSAQPPQFAQQQAGCRRSCQGPSRQQYHSDDLSPLPSVGGWNADMDLIFAPVRAVGPLRSLLLGFSPYAFAGIGGYGARPVSAADTTRATWSLGGGAHHELLGWLGVGAEARYRQPFSSDSAFAESWQDKLEYRVGLTISFGRHRAAPASGDTVSAVDAGAPCGAVQCRSEKGAATIIDPRFASRVLDVADGLVDTPFAAGGTTPRWGFGAAGFVRYVFGQQGVSLPRGTSEIATVGTEVSIRAGALRAGDLLFFANDGTNINHVAIYAGRDRIIHATASGGGVRYDTLGEGERGRWFADHLLSARRIAAGEMATPREDTGASERPDRAPRPQGASR